MGAEQNLDWRWAAASALEWWRDAGVDVTVGDDPFDWLAPEGATVAAAIPIARAADPGDAAPAPVTPLPATLDAFFGWRMGEAPPEGRWGGHAIAAAGPATADLMILLDCPERDDRMALLEGGAGRLFDRMLAAIGRSRADVHLASVCTARPIGGRIPRESEARLAEIARHHVALVAPKRLLALGDAASRALLAANVAESRGRLHLLNHNGGKTTVVVASFHPRFLLERAAAKAEAWRDLQMLVGGLT